MPAPLRILYVEDNPIIRDVTAELLEQGQREIVATATAEEALREFQRTHFDVVITDVSLPVMSGIELARSILNERPQFPIIIASGYSLEFALAKLGDNVRAILKPFAAPEIDAVINELVKT